MADVKISELPAASALDRTEEIPAVQAGDTVKTTIDDILAEIIDGDIPVTLARAADVTTEIGTHSADTTSVHGIADTSALETISGATTKVSNHAAAANPHPTYLTQAEGDAAYEPVGTVATHAAAGNPHSDYALDTDLSTHEADTTSIHGIANTANLETTTGSAAKVTAHEGAANPHPTYLTQAEGDAAYEATGAVATHAGAADPHTAYQKESEKGAASGYASLDAGTKVPTVELGGSGADNTKFLRGDQTWQVPAGGGGGAPTTSQYVVLALDAGLSAERVLAAGPGLELVDGGANGNITIKQIPTPAIAVLNDDFIVQNQESGEIGSLGWDIIGGGTAVNGTGVANHPGFVVITSTSTSGNITAAALSISSSAADILLPAEVERFIWILRVPVITTMKIRCGLITDSDAADGGTAGVYFEYDSALSANWFGVTRAAGAETRGDTTVAMTATNWYQLEARRNGSNWDFYVNGTFRVQNTANLPTTVLGFAAVIETNEAVTKGFDLDYFGMRTTEYGNRWT